ncbi:MAG TPA: addiction module protein [Nannocystis sp.]
MSALTEAVLSLPAEERADLAVQLIESLDEPLPTAEELAEIQREWEEETRRIEREIDAGRMELIPWEVVRAEIFGKRG